jgi:hypothetical protein
MISIKSNDPLHPIKNVPVSIHIQEEPIVVPMPAQWSMVSLPVRVPDPSVSTVFPNAYGGIVFLYDTVSGDYAPITTLENGLGYWVFFLNAQNITFRGSYIDSLSITLARGWNMAGSFTYPIATADITTTPPGLYLLWYGYGNGDYFMVDTLYPGMGYWVESYPPRSCKAILKRSSSLPKGTALSSQGGNSISISQFDKFTITDATGKQQSLYVANSDRNPALADLKFPMPPAFAEAKFDARFESGEMIKALLASTQTDLNIAVKTESQLIKLSWELRSENGFTYEIVQEGSQEASDLSVTGTGSMSMTKPLDGKIRIRAISQGKGAVAELPTEYALRQNYPNPFNPVTTIKYQLPEKANVQLDVFNILGQRVATLVNAEQVAGYYQIPFDAKALSSGIYFYRITAGTFVKSQKMLLMR